MFGSFGLLPIENAVTLQKSQFYPVAESDVALGTPSLQLVSRKLEDIELELRFYGETSADRVEQWLALAKRREPQILVIGGKPLGRWIVVLTVEEIKRALQDRLDVVRLRVTFKEEGAFLWVGNYSPYEPPPSVRKSAEAGISGLSKAALDWLKR